MRGVIAVKCTKRSLQQPPTRLESASLTAVPPPPSSRPQSEIVCAWADKGVSIIFVGTSSDRSSRHQGPADLVPVENINWGLRRRRY